MSLLFNAFSAKISNAFYLAILSDSTSIAKHFQWLNQSSYDKVIVALAGAFFGYVFKILITRFNASTASVESLLRDLAAGSLGETGKRRLKESLAGLIAKCLAVYKPIRNSFMLAKLPESSKYLCLKPIYAVDNSVCPNLSEPSQPLFYISLNYENIIYQDNAEKIIPVRDDEILKEVTTKLGIGISDDIERKIFNQMISINSNIKVAIWIHAPKVLISSSQEISSLYLKISENIKSIIPNSNIYVELHLADDAQENLLNNIFKNEEITNQDLVNVSDSKALFYRLTRNNLKNLLNKGLILTRLNSYGYKIPEEILFPRVTSLASLINNHSLIFINGQPGTGKSDLANAVSDYLAKTSNGLIISVNTNKSLDRFKTAIDTTENTRDFCMLIADMVNTHEDINLEQAYTSTNISKKATLDELSIILFANLNNIYFVVDDYHLYNELLFGSIINILKKNWKIKILLFSRPKINFLNQGIDIGYFNVPSWTTIQAKVILNAWSNNAIDRIDSTFSSQFFKNETSFSTYMLRLIKTQIDNQDGVNGESPDLLLKSEIKRILQNPFELQKVDKVLDANQLIIAIKDAINGEINQNTALELMYKLRGLVNNRPVSVEYDKFISDLGSLSWGSKFSNSYNINSLHSDIASYINYFSSEKLIEMGVFRQINASEVDWLDSFIAEGCLALKFSNDIYYSNNSDNYNELSGRLSVLDDNNSINIIRLIISADLLNKLTLIIVKTNFNQIKILEQLLATWIVSNPKYDNEMEKIINIIVLPFMTDEFNLRKVIQWHEGDINKFILIISIIKKIIFYNLAVKKNFDLLCPVDNLMGSIARISLQSDIQTWYENKEFTLSSVNDYTIMCLMSELCDEKIFYVVLKTYLSISIDDDDKQSNVAKLLRIRAEKYSRKSQNINDRLGLYTNLLNNIFIEQSLDKGVGLLIQVLFNELTALKMLCRPNIFGAWVNLNLFIKISTILRNDVATIAEVANGDVIPVLIKWMVRLESPDISTGESEWKVVRSQGEVYAFPLIKNTPLLIQGIKDMIQANLLIQNVYARNYQIASMNDIIVRCREARDGTNELVSDRAPNNNILQANAVVHYGYVNEYTTGNNIPFVTTTEINTVFYCWRPKLFFQ